MFKNWNWKQWVAFAVIVSFIIALTVLHFVQPKVSYAFTEVIGVISFILGGVVGYLIKSEIIK